MTFRSSLIALCFLALFSCRNDFTLEGEYQDIPVAYAFLNAEDDRHFVRVQKAFLQSGGNAETNAGIADSIYYAADEATVIIENTTDGTSTELERVNGEQFGLDREDGLFATTPNVLYTVRDSDFDLEGGDAIRLVVQRPGQPDAVATINLLPQITINRPTDMARIEEYTRPVVLSWSKEAGAAIYDVTIFFNIRELFPANPSQNRDVRLEWNVTDGFVPGGDQTSDRLVRYDIISEGFYQFLGNALEPNSDVVRRFTDFDIQVSAAGEEVLERRLQESANAGLTSSGVLPRYTNLIGGLGLITSNTTALREGIVIDSGSFDSLRDGRYTRTLGFR